MTAEARGGSGVRPGVGGEACRRAGGALDVDSGLGEQQDKEETHQAWLGLGSGVNGKGGSCGSGLG